MTGVQDVNSQSLILQINAFLRSNAFDPKTTILTRQGNDAAVTKLLSDMNKGNIGALIMAGVNPVYTLPNSEDFIEGLKRLVYQLFFQ